MFIPGIFDGTYFLRRNAFVAQQYGTDPNLLVKMFLASLSKEIGESGVNDVLVFWDYGAPEFRKQNDFYKADREEMNPEVNPEDKMFFDAQDLLNQILPKLGVISTGRRGIEADDFAFLVSNCLEADGGWLFSEDKDWYQSLVPNWSLKRPVSREVCTYEQFKEWMPAGENPAEQYRYYKALVGDSSDGIPGIYGCGPGRSEKFSEAIVLGKDLGNGSIAQTVKDSMEIIESYVKIIDHAWVLDESQAYQDILEADKARVSPKCKHSFVRCA